MIDSSDTEIQALPKKIKKKSSKEPPEELMKSDHDVKKQTTKTMVYEALTELNTRKGVSLQAIKKYMVEKHQIDVDKIGYIIKKAIKNGVEDGTIIQTKGKGASGSFKKASTKQPKQKNKKKPVSVDEKKMEKVNKQTDVKKVDKELDDHVKMKKSASIDKKKKVVEEKNVKKVKVSKEDKNPDRDTEKSTKSKSKKRVSTSVMMKRKSIGSIIKKPKMKPKAGG